MVDEGSAISLVTHEQKEESLTVTKSLNCLETSLGPFFIAFSSSFSFDLRFFTSSVMLSTDNLQTEKSHFIREKNNATNQLGVFPLLYYGTPVYPKVTPQQDVDRIHL